MGRNGANPKGGWSDGDLTDTGRWAKAYFLGEYARSLARRSVNETLSVGSCDCSWTSTCGPHGCGDCKDDGSQCFHECCGSPGPAPTPLPPPLPAATYCPDPATDFQIEVEPGAQGMVDCGEGRIELQYDVNQSEFEQREDSVKSSLAPWPCPKKGPWPAPPLCGEGGVELQDLVNQSADVT